MSISDQKPKLVLVVRLAHECTLNLDSLKFQEFKNNPSKKSKSAKKQGEKGVVRYNL
jgi:hypothetical protein